MSSLSSQAARISLQQSQQGSINSLFLAECISQWLENIDSNQIQTQIDISQLITLRENNQKQLKSKQTQKYREQDLNQNQSQENYYLTLIKQKLRDTSNNIISSQIRKFNNNSSNSINKLQYLQIPSCLSTISLKIVLNYVKLLQFIILTQLKEKKKFQYFIDDLEIFMKKYISYYKLKYKNLWEDDDGYEVLPDKEVVGLIRIMESETVGVQQIHFRKVEPQDRLQQENIGSFTKQMIQQSLQQCFMDYIQKTRTSFTQYEMIVKNISPQIQFISTENLNSFLNLSKKISINGKLIRVKSNYLTKLMTSMLKLIKQRKMKAATIANKKIEILRKNKNFDTIKKQQIVQNEAKMQLKNIFKEKDLNKDIKLPQKNQKIKQKYSQHGSIIQKIETKSIQFQEQREQKVRSYSFSQFYLKNYFDQYKTKNQHQQNKIYNSQYHILNKEIIEDILEYNNSLYQRIQRLLITQIQQCIQNQNLSLNQSKSNKDKIKPENKQSDMLKKIIKNMIEKTTLQEILSQSPQTKSQKIQYIQFNEQYLFSSKLNLDKLINCEIQCTNSDSLSILQKIIQLMNQKVIEILKIQNNLKKQYKHSVNIYFRIKEAQKFKKKEKSLNQLNSSYPWCLLAIKLDQKSQSLISLRHNYKSLYDFLESLQFSPFGVLGQMSQYLTTSLQIGNQIEKNIN